MKKRFIIWIGLALVVLACNFGIESPTPAANLLATLAASTPLGGNQNPGNATPPEGSPTSAFNFETPMPLTSTPFTPQLTVSAVNPPIGKIVFTCQIFKTQEQDQVCVINADGSGFRRLTTNDNKQHYYPSFAPDGKSLVYAAYREANYFDIYEMDVATGSAKRITEKKVGNIDAPEISPDGKQVVYKMWNPRLNINALYIMDREGKSADRFTKIAGWNPTWSPDGSSILFASNTDGDVQLYISTLNGKLHRTSNLPGIRGWSDWSPDGKSIVTDSGVPWNHEVYIMNEDGSSARALSPLGGNAQEPSFSPDGKWIVFSAYYDHMNDENGCEIYILRADGTDLRRLTNNGYCDYQPRWGW
jgi:Tol biopolymer transport system component